MALPGFRTLVIEIVQSIPSGRLMTYGQIAALAGSPRAARIVGGIAHFGNSDIPWHRIVNKTGKLARGYPGGLKAHQDALAREGVEVIDYRVAIDRLIWWPENYE